VKGFGEFQNDRSLTQEEDRSDAQWVEAEPPRDDPNLLPERPSAAVSKKPVRAGMPVNSPFTLPHDMTVEAIRPTKALLPRRSPRTSPTAL